jgi:hypothetical protein
LRTRQVASGHHAHAALLVEFHRRGLVAAISGDVEPETEAAGGAVIAEAIAEDLVGEVELDPVQPPVLLDMDFVAVGGDRHMLQRHRHLRRGHIAQLVKHRQKLAVAGGEADPHTRQIRALRQRLKRNHIGKIGPRAFQHAARGFEGVDLRIAFVAQHHEAEAIGQLFQADEIIPRSYRTLRIGRRRKIDRHRSRQGLVIERVEVWKKSVCRRGRKINRLAAGGVGAGAIGRIKRIGQQDRRRAPALRDVTGGGDGGEEQTLAAAIEHQNFGLGIDRAGKAEPCSQPVCGGAAERLDTFGDGVTAEIGGVFGQHRADEAGHGMLRFAQRQRNQRFTRLIRRQKLGQPGERRAFAVLTDRLLAVSALRRTGRGGHCHC